VKSATAREQLEFPFEQRTIDVAGHSFTFRELSVQENDDCADSSKDPDGRINGRTMVRLMIIASSIEPKLTPKILGTLPQRVYAKIYDIVNDLNDPDSLGKNKDIEVDDEGNA
jgi:hypothetical protein